MSSSILKSPLPYIALLIAHLIWGANFVVAKITLQEIPPNSLALMRFAFASILLAPFFLAQTRKVKIDKQDIPKLIIIGVLIITLNISFFFEGIIRTTVINASVLSLVVPILSVFFGWIFLREKVYIVNLIGIFVGLLGALIIIRLPQLFIGTFSPKEMVGNILIILASLAWVVGSVFSRQLLKKYPSLIVTTAAFLVGTVTFLVPAVNEYVQNPTWIQDVSMLGVLGIIYITILSSISAYFLFEWGLAKTSVFQANILHYVEPFVAAALGITLLGEELSVPLVAGGILIMAGVCLGTMAKEYYHRTHKIHRF